MRTIHGYFHGIEVWHSVQSRHALTIQPTVVLESLDIKVGMCVGTSTWGDCTVKIIGGILNDPPLPPTLLSIRTLDDE
jgi:hypothetical protein